MRICSVVVLLCAVAFPVSHLGAAAPQLTVNLERSSEPVSQYIYGQFIEHLGRCIYGGLWSEMLEDRKFYYPITGEGPAWQTHQPGESSWEGEGHPYELLVRSPWMILGPAGSVQMVSRDAFVGDHSPEIRVEEGARTGIFQERLSLKEGAAYSGRIVLRAAPGISRIEVRLVWGGGASDSQTQVLDKLEPEFSTWPLKFQAKATTDNGRLEILGSGNGSFRIGAVSLMPADNILGWRSDTVERLRELDSPIYRWPGGNFVSGYNWRDGIGNRDHRPPRKNPAWKGIEPNDVGLHEFLDLCREIGAEPYIAVNTGLGGTEEAAALVEYANGSPDTPLGGLRARNGHREPFGVRWWAVGNEMYGEWQLGNIPLDQYVRKHNTVVDAMRAVDPSISAVAVGNVGEWSRNMLSSCADHMTLISEHLYWQDKDDLVEHVRQAPEAIRRVAEEHREYRRTIASLQDKDIRIALDEWNYWYGPNEFGELGTRYFLQDALGIAAGLHELIRQSDLFFMANYAQTVNVIGAIKTSPAAAEFETTGLVLKLYRERFGRNPVEVEGVPEPLDVVAALTPDRSAITLAAVNPDVGSTGISVRVLGGEITGRARRWVISGSTRWAFNSPGRERAVEIEHNSFTWDGESLELLPISVTLYWLELR